MIPLEKQVTSLELSKELKKLGVKQDSLFWWVKHIKSGTNYYIWDLVYIKDENDLVNKYISAFTVAELGELLPKYVTSEKVGEGKFFVKSEDAIYNTLENTEANARAKMLIYLIKNEFTEAK